MQSAQESKQELEAAIRYAENAISSANKTIESMEFRQEMAKKQYAEQTGREAVLESELAGVRQLLDKTTLENVELEERNDELNAQVADLNVEVQRQQGLGQGYYDNMMEFKSQIVRLERDLTAKTSQAEAWKKEVEKLRKEKEASSGPCGCQAYRDLEAENAKLREDKERLTALEIQLRNKIRELKAQVKQ